MVDQQFITMISNRLPLFTMKSHHPMVGNFRCVICGDSRTNPHKKRGYITFDSKSSQYRYFCHNCQYSKPFYAFLREWDPATYKQYCVEIFKQSNNSNEHNLQLVAQEEVKPLEDVLRGLIKISKLPANHPAKRYIDSRQIPPDKHWDLYFSPNYLEHIAANFAQYADLKTPKADPRIVFPMRRRNKDVFGLTGRSILPKSELRYLINRLSSDDLKCYGLSNIDPNRTVTVTEGPIDSLFVSNCIAVMGQHFPTEQIAKTVNCSVNNLVFVLDNEPRSPNTVRRMGGLIDSGLRVFIPPEHMVHKDLNDHKIANPTADIDSLIRSNTYQGLSANLAMARWSKINASISRSTKSV